MDIEISNGRPAKTAGLPPQELESYALLERLGIEFYRAGHPAAATIAELPEVEAALGVAICKNLFLCNRQQTQFYLLLVPGQKGFKTKYLSAQLGVARLSFAPPEEMERLLGLSPGSVSVLGLQYDSQKQVRLVLDEQMLQSESVGFHPCINTATVKFRTADLLDKLLPALGYAPTIVSLPQPEPDES